MHPDSCFVTLTFDDEHLPGDYSVRVRDVQLFMKKLRDNRRRERRRIAKERGCGLSDVPEIKIRFYAVGEYGSLNLRPHYHILIFGYLFPDKKFWRKTEQGHMCFVSEELKNLWPYGHHEIGSLTPWSAAYAAGYVNKKIGVKRGSDHYKRQHPVSGAWAFVEPEFAVMSSNPGIGASFFDKYSSDVFPSDFLIVDGKKVPVPTYFSNKLKGRFENENSDPDALLVRDDLTPIREKRKASMLRRAADNTPERLAVREESARLRRKRFVRALD